MYTIIDFCIKSTHPSTYIHVFTDIHRFLSNKIFQFHRLNVNYRKGRSSTYYFLGKGREINMCRSKVNSLTIRNWCCSLSNSMMRWAADVFFSLDWEIERVYRLPAAFIIWTSAPDIIFFLNKSHQDMC